MRLCAGLQTWESLKELWLVLGVFVCTVKTRKSVNVLQMKYST